jgi:urease accessory protein
MTLARRLAALLLASLPGLALAHPGHDGSAGFVAGLAHPLLGADHLVAALLAGCWAAQRGGTLRLAIPATFLAMLAAGLLTAAWTPVASTPVEHAIALSVLVLGLAVAFSWRLAMPACLALAGTFAFVHGLAHGAERPGEGLLAYGTGLTLATTVLLVAGGLTGTALLRNPESRVLRVFGAAAATGGLALLAAG